MLRNPSIFCSWLIELCSWLQVLRKHLLEELEQAFPDEVESYREIRSSSVAVSLPSSIHPGDNFRDYLSQKWDEAADLMDPADDDPFGSLWLQETRRLAQAQGGSSLPNGDLKVKTEHQ